MTPPINADLENRLCRIERQMDVLVTRVEYLINERAAMLNDIKYVTSTLSQHRGRDTVVIAILSVLATIAGAALMHSKLFGG